MNCVIIYYISGGNFGYRILKMLVLNKYETIVIAPFLHSLFLVLLKIYWTSEYARSLSHHRLLSQNGQVLSRLPSLLPQFSLSLLFHFSLAALFTFSLWLILSFIIPASYPFLQFLMLFRICFLVTCSIFVLSACLSPPLVATFFPCLQDTGKDWRGRSPPGVGVEPPVSLLGESEPDWEGSGCLCIAETQVLMAFLPEASILEDSLDLVRLEAVPLFLFAFSLFLSVLYFPLTFSLSLHAINFSSSYFSVT